MFPDLVAPLGWSDKTPPIGTGVLITDSQGADSSFLLNHFIGLHLRAQHAVCLVGVAQSKLHYSVIAKKLGHPVDANFLFIDAMTQLLSRQPPTTSDDGAGAAAEATGKDTNTPTFCLEDGLSTLLDLIDRLVTESSAQRCCVIIDDLGLFQDVGLPLQDVLHFAAECQARFCAGTGDTARGTVVMLCHGLASDPEEEDTGTEDTPGVDDDMSLARHLRFGVDVTLAVTGLKSGYSREVHGQLVAEKVKPGSALPSTTVLQFKTKDNGVTFFAPGTSSAVL